MIKNSSSLVSLGLALLAAGAVLPAEFAAQELEGLTDAIFAEWTGSDSPGCAVAVMYRGEIEYAQGYGVADLEHDVPITPSTVFYIGSTSKQFVTVCIALLEESGKLDFDDEVREHIPEFPQYEEPVTIRQLIHHTSGVRDYLELWSLAGRDYLDYMPEQAVLDLICRQEELNFEPGSRDLYSNSCYFLLGVLVERVSGMSLREYAKEHVFGPLGMKSSRFHDDHEELIANRAFSYSPNGEGGYANLIMRFDLVGSGGVYSTVEDLALWDRNFYDNQLGKGGPELLETMHTRGVLDNGRTLDYAFALSHGSYRGAKTVSHGGALAGYRAQFMRFPELDLSVAILCNLGSMNSTLLAERVADVWLEHELAPRPVAQPTEKLDERESAKIDPATFEPYVGSYDLSSRMIEIDLDGDRVTMSTDEGEKIRLWPESETSFFAKEVSMSVRFEPEDGGSCNKIVVTLRGQEMRGVRTTPATIDLEELQPFAGDYACAELDVTYHLRVEDEGLTVAVGYAPKQTLEKNDGGVWGAAGVIFEFDRNGGGDVTGFRVSTGRVKNLKFVRN